MEVILIWVEKKKKTLKSSQSLAKFSENKTENM